MSSTFLKTLIYIELYKEPSFEYIKESVTTIESLLPNELIECDNFSDEVTFSMIHRVLAEKECVLIVNALSADTEFRLLSGTIRKFQKKGQKILLVGEHPLFNALSKRNDKTQRVENFEQLIKTLKS